jgi:hypothetical protein
MKEVKATVYQNYVERCQKAQYNYLERNNDHLPARERQALQREYEMACMLVAQDVLLSIKYERERGVA